MTCGMVWYHRCLWWRCCWGFHKYNIFNEKCNGLYSTAVTLCQWSEWWKMCSILCSSDVSNMLSRSLRVSTKQSVQILARSYHPNVIDHYENPRNVGSLDKKKKTLVSLSEPLFISCLRVGTGLVGAPACGDVMKLQFEVDESGTIIDAKFKTFGCGSAIASSSVATEWLKGRKVEDCLSIKVSRISDQDLL